MQDVLHHDKSYLRAEHWDSPLFYKVLQPSTPIRPLTSCKEDDNTLLGRHRDMSHFLGPTGLQKRRLQERETSFSYLDCRRADLHANGSGSFQKVVLAVSLRWTQLTFLKNMTSIPRRTLTHTLRLQYTVQSKSAAVTARLHRDESSVRVQVTHKRILRL